MLLALALIVNIYWLTVVSKTIFYTIKNGKTPNVLPKENMGRLHRAFLFPLLAVWNYLPWHVLATKSTHQIGLLSMLGVLFALAAWLLSLYCWHFMGRAWRVGINPKEKTKIVTGGPFKYVRHPIYTLSMMLMLGTFLTLQTTGALILWIVHFALYYAEGCREEQYILQQNNKEYEAYISKTGRFLPRLSV